MTQDQTHTGAEKGTEGENGEQPPPRYFVDLEAAKEHDRAISVLIASRRCYMDQQADEEGPSPTSDAQEYIDRIAEHCAQTPDYLLPDTPLKEAIFRVILAGGNKPTTAEEISEVLSEKWAMTAYPRDVSPRVIQRLLDHSESYCIAQAPEPVKEVKQEEDAGEQGPEKQSHSL